jgi:hypothetical protein
MTTKEIMQRATSETIVRMPVGLQGEEGIVGLFSFGTFSPPQNEGEEKKEKGQRDDNAAPSNLPPFQEPNPNWSRPHQVSPLALSSSPILEAPDCLPIPCGIAARLSDCFAGSLARSPSMIRDGVEPTIYESTILRERNALVWVARTPARTRRA